MQSLVILVDPDDNQVGTMEKLEAHEKGVLHRAFSIFVFNSKKELLIHRRAETKYHTPGLWTNTCCSHQIPGFDTIDFVQKRLQEEMGMKAFDYHKAFTHTYKADLGNGLIEHELDHIYIAKSDDLPNPNPEEVSEYLYKPLDEIVKDVALHPQDFTPWFKQLLGPIKNYLERNPLFFNN